MIPTLSAMLDDRMLVHDFAPNGGSPQVSVYLQAQLHGNETTGALVLHALVDRYRREAPPVPVRIVPHANPFAWDIYLHSGEGRISKPGERNWNRIFGPPLPSSPAPAPTVLGQTTEDALRDRLWSLSKSFDVVLDLHTPEFGLPHVYIASAETGLNTFADLPHVVYGEPSSPTFDEAHLRYALSSGREKHVATLELPSNRLITKDIISAWADRVHQEVCSYAAVGGVPKIPAVRGKMIDLVPGISGIALPMAEPGEECAVGESVLRVVSHSGEYEDLIAPANCIPVCYRRSTMVKAGHWAIRVIGLENLW